MEAEDGFLTEKARKAERKLNWAPCDVSRLFHKLFILLQIIIFKYEDYNYARN